MCVSLVRNCWCHLLSTHLIASGTISSITAVWNVFVVIEEEYDYWRHYWIFLFLSVDATFYILLIFQSFDISVSSELLIASFLSNKSEMFEMAGVSALDAQHPHAGNSKYKVGFSQL